MFSSQTALRLTNKVTSERSSFIKSFRVLGCRVVQVFLCACVGYAYIKVKYQKK
jgi:hypothetical protein